MVDGSCHWVFHFCLIACKGDAVAADEPNSWAQHISVTLGKPVQIHGQIWKKIVDIPGLSA